MLSNCPSHMRSLPSLFCSVELQSAAYTNIESPDTSALGASLEHCPLICPLCSCPQAFSFVTWILLDACDISSSPGGFTQ